MLYKDRDWLNQITTIQSARTNCVNKIKNGVKLDSYLNWNDIKSFVKDEICLSVLENEKISNLINKRTYQVIENKIDQFNSFISYKKEDIFKGCLKRNTDFKKESCIRKQWEMKIGLEFNNWTKLQKNKEYTKYKDLFIRRTKTKSTNSRTIASE